MRPAPERRSDGRCLREGCSRLVPTTTAKNRVDVEVALRREAFCSRRCSDLWSGVVTDDLDDMVALFAAGETPGAIARALGTDARTIRARLKEAGAATGHQQLQ
jgi:hypothetical protein